MVRNFLILSLTVVHVIAAVTELPGTSNAEVIYEQCGGWCIFYSYREVQLI